MSLTELKADVDADAALHMPDLTYNIQSNEHALRFEVVEMAQLLDGETDTVGLHITLDRQGTPQEHNYVFSRWSRLQLLSLMGTRERWFASVDLACQVRELNERLHVLENYNIRTAKAVDEDFPVRFVRGIVSHVYADIPNPDIMESIIAKMPENAAALRRYSGLTDRAFYAYVVSPSPITIPGTQFFAYPGAVVKNSDVGFTSLYVIPMLMIRSQGAPVVLEAQAVLKRIHRGKVDLPEKFDEAFRKCASLWSDLATKIPYLASKSYANADQAIETMARLLTSALATKEFIQKCRHAYAHTTRHHTALDIFETIVEVCATFDDRDDNYAVGAIAGAVLFKLLF